MFRHDTTQEARQNRLDATDLTVEEILAVREFVRRIGGMEAAKQAAEMLSGGSKEAA